MYHTMTIAGLKRNLPLCKLNDELSIAAFVIFGDAPLTVACAQELLKKAPKYDYVITAEAKGIPLAHEMARQNGDVTYFVARKVPKLYMTGVFEVTVRSITTAKEQKLYLDTAEAEKIRGKRILIVDDVIS
ncbi:MAG TPA: phosphoribosyltransferase family protein, partial [Clostridiales bacterium]|nr:phosphoribosyltransferase family protein [Clostridiales bacterium]